MEEELRCCKKKQLLGFNVGRMNDQKHRAAQSEQGEW